MRDSSCDSSAAVLVAMLWHAHRMFGVGEAVFYGLFFWRLYPVGPDNRPLHRPQQPHTTMSQSVCKGTVDSPVDHCLTSNAPRRAHDAVSPS
jgi:hypothetical protein